MPSEHDPLAPLTDEDLAPEQMDVVVMLRPMTDAERALVEDLVAMECSEGVRFCRYCQRVWPDDVPFVHKSWCLVAAVLRERREP